MILYAILLGAVLAALCLPAAHVAAVMLSYAILPFRGVGRVAEPKRKTIPCGCGVQNWAPETNSCSIGDQ